MKNYLLTPLAMLCLIFCNQGLAQNPIDDSLRVLQVIDSLEKSFKWQTGAIELPNGVAKIEVPQGFRYLDVDQSKFVLENLWGNPPREGGLGMLFPLECTPFTLNCYAFNISYDEMGFVKDTDADKINYTDLMRDLKREAKEANKSREAAGYTTAEIIGWASEPYYDKEKKVLHWAKQIKFSDEPSGQSTLNYDARILGRKGVISLNAIGDMDQLNNIKPVVPAVLSAVTFNQGYRYADFDSKVDDVAAWTIGGLVAGKVLAKAGFFAIILKFIKPIILGLIALGALVMRYFTGRRKEEETYTQEEDTTPENNTPVES